MFENLQGPKPAGTDEPVDMFDRNDGIIEPGEIKSALANQKLKPVASATVPASPAGRPTARLPAGRQVGIQPAHASLPPPNLPIGQSAVAEEVEAVTPKVEISQPVLSKKGIFLVVGLILIIAVGAGVGFTLWRSAKKAALSSQQPASSNQPPTEQAPVSEQAPAAEVAPAPITPVVGPETPAAEVSVPAAEVAPTPQSSVVTPLDTDGDGLTDDEEARLGTDASKLDTDEDGLTDYEETVIWKTNPLSADTDGDGYLDGMEVRNGYNPLGAGKLLQVPQ